MKRPSVLVGLLVLVTLLIAVHAAIARAPSTPPAQKPSFEVGSVKAYVESSGPPNFSGFFQNQPGGRFTVAGVSLKMLMFYAYRILDLLLVGGPDWVSSDQWEVSAKAEDGVVPYTRVKSFDPAVPDTMALMVQSLIEDQFQLKIHRETRELPVYDLVVAKGGSKLQLSKDQSPPEIAEPDKEPVSPPPDGAGGPPTPARGNLSMFGGPSGSTILGNAIPLSYLAGSLSGHVGRMVIDKTNLKPGRYDLKLQWSSDSADSANSLLNSSGPSIFTAIQKQLGLRLVPGKGPVQVIVVDSAKKPTED